MNAETPETKIKTREAGKPDTWPDGVEGNHCPNDACPSAECPEAFKAFGGDMCSRNWQARMAAYGETASP